MDTKPLLSVIMSAYNGERFIRESVESVLQQSYSPIELVVCDDGSTDRTAEILASYGVKVTYVYQQNQGQGRGRNNAVSHSSGELLAFIDADDVWKPDKLTKQIDLFLKSRDGVGCIYGNMEVVDEAGKHIRVFSSKRRMKKGNILSEILKDSFIGLSSIVVRRSVFEEVGGFTNHRYCQDFAFLVEVAKKYDFDFIDEPLVKYREHPGSVTKNIDLAYPDSISFLSGLLHANDLNARQKRNVKSQLKRLFISYAFLSYLENRDQSVSQIISQCRTIGMMPWKLRLLSLFNHRASSAILLSIHKIKSTINRLL